MNQSEFLEITYNLLKAREKSRVQSVICFRFAFDWLKNWREIFKSTTKRNHKLTLTSFLGLFLSITLSTRC